MLLIDVVARRVTFLTGFGIKVLLLNLEVQGINSFCWFELVDFLRPKDARFSSPRMRADHFGLDKLTQA